MAGIQDYRDDKTAEKEGTWVNLKTETGTLLGRFLIARAGGDNVKFYTILAEITEKTRPVGPVVQQVNDIEDAPDYMARLGENRELYARGCLLDWKDVEGPDGKALKFSEENAVALVNDVSIVFDLVYSTSRDSLQYLVEQVKADAGNSPKSSSTK